MTKSPYKLQLTKGFFVDFQQIARMLAFAIKNRETARIPADMFVEHMGVSSSRVGNLSSIATAFGLINAVVLSPTVLALLVYDHDPYLDDIGTLWLFHYLISSNERYVVWNRLVNLVIPENNEFSTLIARPYFADLNQFYSEHSMDKHISKEIGAIWNAYTEQAFRYLDYIQSDSDLIYTRGQQASVPPLIFCASLLKFRELYYSQAATLDISQLTDDENSPGRVFGLPKRQVRDLLEEVKLSGFIFVESRADLDQVRFRDEINFLNVVGRYYEER
jgi:hypothetical protein